MHPSLSDDDSAILIFPQREDDIGLHSGFTMASNKASRALSMAPTIPSDSPFHPYDTVISFASVMSLNATTTVMYLRLLCLDCNKAQIATLRRRKRLLLSADLI